MEKINEGNRFSKLNISNRNKNKNIKVKVATWATWINKKYKNMFTILIDSVLDRNLYYIKSKSVKQKHYNQNYNY